MRPRRHRLIVLTTAMTVALVAGGVVVIAQWLSAPESPPASHGAPDGRWHPDLPRGIRPAAVPGVVPPVSQEVSFPGAEVAGAFTPALSDSEGEPLCGADDITVGIDRGEGPGQIIFRLEAARDRTCVVNRYPFQQYTRDGRPVEVLSRIPAPRPGDWPASVPVAPGRAAELHSTWVGWCQPPPFDTVELIFDDNSVRRLQVAGQLTSCAGAGHDELPERMVMTGWEPETWQLGPPADFSGLQARLVQTVEGPGDLPTWVVELTARRDVDLGTCPSWEVRQGSEEAVSWRLNCRGVPHTRDGGTPYLPAGEPVRFGVWASYGGTDAPLTWVLTTPDGPVSVALTEGPPAPAGLPRRVREDEANLHLWLSNQSYDDPEVHLTVEVDGVQVVDEDFRVEGQHNFVDFHLAVPAGQHDVVVTSDSRAMLVRSVLVPRRGDRWAAALYWGSADSPTLEWMFQDHPIGWA